MQVSLQGGDCGKHHDSKKGQQDSNRGRDQDVVQRPAAMCDELAPLSMPQVSG
jgi:hypothetical protein